MSGTARRDYRHPGQAFLSRWGVVRSEADVWRYVDFLRQEAGLSDQPPIALAPIYRHFGIPEPIRAPLDEQQGILLDSSSGIILIKEDDPIVRQRFTEGHELMELLFDANETLRSSSFLPAWSTDHKERLCDRGAADLLMPRSSFVPQLQHRGLSLQTGRSLATLYQTSLLATLVRMIQFHSGQAAIVVWHLALTQRERSQPTRSSAKKLRVWWSVCSTSWAGGFIPKNKSVPPDSLITQVHHSAQPQQGYEAIDFGWNEVHCHLEAIPLQLGGKSCVLSLLSDPC